MLILMILLLKHTLLVLYMIIVLIKVIAMTGRNVLTVVNWGGVDTPLVCERGRESFYSSEMMSKEVNKAFDKELGEYNTLLIYNCHCL